MNIFQINAGCSELITWSTFAAGRPVQPESLSVAVSEDGVTKSLVYSPAWDETDGCVKLVLSPEDFPASLIGHRFRFVFTWTYQGNSDREERVYEVVPSAGTSTVPFSSISADAKLIIRKVQERFVNLQDSVEGGLHLTDVATFGDDTWAMLLESAIETINSKGGVYKTFSLSNFPYTSPNGAGVVKQALLIEVIEHVMLSYTEDPLVEGMGSAPTLNRRDYVSRWQTVKGIEDAKLTERVKSFDRSLMDFNVSIMIGTRQLPYGLTDRVRPSIPPWYRWL